MIYGTFAESDPHHFGKAGTDPVTQSDSTTISCGCDCAILAPMAPASALM
jgi:hypothetical protein